MKTPDTHKIKRALISVSDKAGIAEFAQKLHNLGIEIFSTGGTAKLIRSNDIPVKDVSELTGFPEVMDGRLKTLHPIVHGGLLAELNKDSHLEQMKEHGIDSIDMLIVNLYPFEETLKKEGSTHEDIIENIDIGGPTMLRAAAKNYLWTAPVVNPTCYDNIIKLLEAKDCTIPEDARLELADEVFAHTAYYDSIISEYLRKKINNKQPKTLTVPMQKLSELRYGENPHQMAMLYGRNFDDIFQKLHGKDLSYNNIMDIDAAAKLILEFDETACAIIKHTNPCGAAIGKDLSDAYNKAFATDNVSPFGGIIIVNETLDLKSAETMNGIFTELIIAPEFSEEALELLMKKKNRRLITFNADLLRQSLGYDMKTVAGGFLYQKTDTILVDDTKLKVVTEKQPTEAEMDAMMFAWKICKHVKSNAIVYTANDRTLGIGAGQMSRVDSARIAVAKSKLMEIDLKGSVCASDAFFPFADGVEQAVEAGATCIIQPGGSVRDQEVIDAANVAGVAMVFTGMRHFRH
jgi:phosphoribosylaminoimidazolecarboxamide formyltransferase / IMP cyclohydrolase